MRTRFDCTINSTPAAGAETCRCSCPRWAAISSGVPVAVIRPPAAPPSGPRSISQSADLITSRLCSITSTVLPRSTSRVEHGQQLANVVEVQAGGRFVQDVERATGIHPGQLGGQLDPLGLAARERRGRLAERQIAQPDFGQPGQQPDDGGKVLEELQGFFDPHVERVGDRLAAIADFQGLAVEAGPFAERTDHGQVGQEVHFDLPHPLPLAFLAAAPFDVEAEAADPIAELPGFAACRRTPCGFRRTPPCTWPDCSAACGRSATGRLRSACRSGSLRAGCDADPAWAPRPPAGAPKPGPGSR